MVGAGALAACGVGGAPSGAGQSAGGQKLTGSFEFWQPWPIEQPTHGGPIGWKQLSENYNMKGGAQVKMISPAGNAAIETPLQTAFAGGNPPDGWQASQQWTVVYAAKGFSTPLDDLIKRDKWDTKKIFSSSLRHELVRQGVGVMQHPDSS